MRCSIALTLVLATAIGFAPGPLRAEIYRWVDEAGVPHYAEGIDSIPERYRAHATPLGLRNRPAASDSGQKPPAGETVIRYAPGQRIMAEVRINGAASARLIFDTGADRTLISPRASPPRGCRSPEPSRPDGSSA